MHRRDAAAAFVVTLLLLNFVPMMSSDDAEAHVYDDSGRALDGVLFYEVAPTNKCEGFALKNYSEQIVDLNGYTVRKDPQMADGMQMRLSGTIGPGDVAVFAKSVSGDYWFTTEQHVGGFDREVYTVKAVDPDCKGFSLGNKNGQLLLYDGGGLIDTVAYKSGSGFSEFESVSLIGWIGAPAYLGKTDDAVRRVEPKDTNSAFDWIPAGNGMSSNGAMDVPAFDVQVKPFTFPESSGRYVYEEIENATESIHISIYMLTSPYIVSLLCQKADDGVQVNLMLENKPLGYGHTEYLLKALDGKKGAEVRFIGADSELDRYSYVHNKYMIADGDTVVITSENWTSGNMQCVGDPGEGNRGWGAVVYSAPFAQYMESEYFSNDWNYGDVASLEERTWTEDDNTGPGRLPAVSQVRSYMNRMTYTSGTFDANVSIYMSPDNTFKALTYLMSNAKDRIYTEQMDIGESYSDLANNGPLRYMSEAALRGVDARLLTTDKDAKVLVDMLSSETNIKASKMADTGYATMHNKGVIIDDAVWVSSVNWTENSFINNRECGLLIRSPEVSGFYAEAYASDWGASYKGIYNGTIVPDKVPTEGEASDIVLAERTGAVGDWTVHYKDGSTESFDGQTSITVKYGDDLAYVVYDSSDGENHARYVFGSMPADSQDGGITTKQVVEIGGLSALALIILALISKFRKR